VIHFRSLLNRRQRVAAAPRRHRSVTVARQNADAMFDGPIRRDPVTEAMRAAVASEVPMSRLFGLFHRVVRKRNHVERIAVVEQEGRETEPGSARRQDLERRTEVSVGEPAAVAERWARDL